ncbi:endoplasmic reticulum vesicle transporter, putative [Bodo saltans]|uniref:Endoplasmic reticulum vesicle transporter, putative n=1 Tax=Bodo saltans TaxID=75058 RepID=A0A0S4J3I3_BODSA|nr:endoplasmic reticulum vesicle transporter, putative [Bodo saltans]|eukprot:CUG85973.1 endoplasmic reticulum vesicle transporter, putative [Bodo saltans]
MGLGQNFKRVDFYRRVPVDLTEPTAPGAIISIVCGLVMVLLLWGEIRSYLSPRPRSDMFVAPDEGQGSKLRVNFNMTFHKLPCFALSFDVLDVLGRHEMNVLQNTKKYRLSQSGENLGEFHGGNFAEQNKEGCNTVGFVHVAKVPGNFHVSAHGLQNEVAMYLGGNINVQHTIHHLAFGDNDVMGKLDHDLEGHVHPLNREAHKDDGAFHYEYFLDIVPTVYKQKWGKSELRGYQFTANMHKTESPPGHMAAAFFRYQLSPITVRYSAESTSFLHFLTYVCAIIGGVFTVSGILSRMIHTTAVQFQRRILGKDQ